MIKFAPITLPELSLWEGVGLVLAVLSFPIAWYLGRRTRQVSDLRYALNFEVLLSTEDGIPEQGVRIATSGHDVSRLSRTRLAVWNQTGDAVRRADVLAADPLRISFVDGDRVLSARVLTSSRPQIRLDTTVDSSKEANQVLVEFEFLNPRDGGIIEVLHEGKGAPKVEGTLVGGKIRSKSANLSNRSLVTLAHSSLFLRLRHVVSMRKRWLVFQGITLTLGLFALGYSLNEARVAMEPEVVDYSNYQMRTLEGQQEFASEVKRVNPSSEAQWLLLGMSLVYFALPIVLVYSLTATVVPPGVVQKGDIQEDPDLRALRGRNGR